jgi:hypothetical protein
MITHKILTAAGVVLILLSVQNSVANIQTVAGPTSVVHDTRFVAAMHGISSLVSPGSTLVVSTNAPFVIYFTGRKARVPFGVSSKAELVEYMKRNQFQYLVVFAGSSQVPELNSLFSSHQVLSLESDFQLVEMFQTDSSTIYLFKLKQT